jgi:SAM-dependent methyltransferase
MEEAEFGRIAAAEGTHWWYRNMRALVRDLLGEALRPGQRVLDAGCGPGGNSAWLLPQSSVVGVDIEPIAVRLARERHPGMDVREGSITSLPFEDGAFDLVLVLTVLAHVEDDRGAVAEVARVLRPGGAAFFIEPAGRRLRRGHDAAVHSLHRYRLRELEDRVRGAGLDVRRSTHAYSFLVPPVLVLALLHRLRGGRAAKSDLERDRLGWLFGPLAAAERRLLQWMDMPFGLSAIVVAARPEEEGSSQAESASEISSTSMSASSG